GGPHAVGHAWPTVRVNSGSWHTPPGGTMTTTLDTPVAVPANVLQGFLEVPPPTIGHVRQTGFMDTEIKPIYRLGRVVVGRAVTLKMTPGDATLTRPAIAALTPGDILVVDCAGNRQIAAWGEMTSLAAKVRGAVG